MLKRVLSAAVFVVIVVGFFFLRVIHPAIFEILILAFAAIGTFEILRAFGGSLTKAQKVITMIYACASVPVSWFFGMGVSAFLFIAVVIVHLSLGVLSYEKVTLEGTGLALFASAYPSLILTTLTGINALSDYSTVALMLVFVVSPFTDTFAFFVGSLLQGPKLSPRISPKKTVSGAFGGIFGGIIGAVAIYLIYGLALSRPVPHWWIFVAIGAIGALADEFGDLVESMIKRKIGIKDLGKIMPGHGGVMDRIDGAIFLCPLVFVCFRLLLHF